MGAHFGGWSVWDDAVKLLSGYPNFYVDTSSSFSDISMEKAQELIARYTPDKVIFGTDYPLGDSAKEVEFLKRAVKNEDVFEKILFKNAVKLFDFDSI